MNTGPSLRNQYTNTNSPPKSVQFKFPEFLSPGRPRSAQPWPNLELQSSAWSKATRGRDPLKDLGSTPVTTLEKPTTVDFENTETILIKDLEYLGSYNWVETEEPTILVPGSPPVWRDITLPFSVEQDDNSVNFVYKNVYTVGKPVLVPLIEAVEIINRRQMEPTFDWSSVDFVTDRNGLRKLLRWVGSSESSKSLHFRIDTQLAGDKTVLLNYWEEWDRESSGGWQANYGHNFETKVTDTAAGCEGSSGHHRIVTYDFDGLKLVVRFEVDAGLPTSELEHQSGSKTVAKPSMDSISGGSAVDVDLAGLVSELRIDPTSKSKGNNKSLPELKVVWGGAEAEQSSLIEMKTRSSNSNASMKWKDTYPQLYFSQTQHLYIAVHDTGNFTEIRKEDVSSNKNLIQAATNAQSGFRMLRKALETIQALVKEHGLGGRISLVCRSGALKVYVRKSGDSCLPDNFLALFQRKN